MEHMEGQHINEEEENASWVAWLLKCFGFVWFFFLFLFDLSVKRLKKQRKRKKNVGNISDTFLSVFWVGPLKSVW